MAKADSKAVNGMKHFHGFKKHFGWLNTFVDF